MPIIGGRQIGVRGLGFQGAGKPNQVTGLSATDFGTSRAYNDGRIDLSWSTPANNGAPITGYRIERSTDNISYSAISVNTGTTATTYSDTGLNSNQIYYYKVAAINAVDTGELSAAANATSTTVPQAPTIGTATGGNAQATVTYTAGATGGKTVTAYTATSSPGGLTGTGSSPITVSGLTNGTAYTFTVTATNANGTSSASAASNSVTPVLPKPVVTGGTLYSDATYYYRVFTSNGTLSITGGTITWNILSIGGGGGGAGSYSGIARGSGTTYIGGQGGAGGIVYNTYTNQGSLSVVIGAGGAGGTGQNARGTSGSVSQFPTVGMLDAGGGGGGGTYNTAAFAGNATNGNGGGAGWYLTLEGGVFVGGSAGSQGAGSGAGFPGGTALSTETTRYSGGGGGAGEAGNTDAVNYGGDGVTTYSSWGLATSTGENVSGTVWYAGGGGGAQGSVDSRGLGGGGFRDASATNKNGKVNTGGGAGGADEGGLGFNGTGGTGGSGIVIVRYTKSQVD